MGVEDMEMVPHGDAAFLRPPRLRLGGGVPGLHHRAQLHAPRKGSVFRLWPPEELPELRVAGPGVAGVDDHVPQRPQAQQGLTEGLQGTGGGADRGHHLAPKDRNGQGAGLLLPRRDLL